MQDKLECSVFAGMPSGRRIVVVFDDLGIELLAIKDIQFSLVVQESIEFFPLKKVVNQSVRAFFTEYFECLGGFYFMIKAFSNLLFEF
jgi:hypothetical protein